MGYDFIMDDKLNTYLIEVNTNPCLEESNSLLKSLVPRMIDDMFNIVCDPIFYNSNYKNIILLTKYCEYVWLSPPPPNLTANSAVSCVQCCENNSLFFVYFGSKIWLRPSFDSIVVAIKIFPPRKLHEGL